MSNFSHFLYYLQLSIAHYQVSSYANVVIYPKPTAKRELITKRERARGWFGIKNIVI